MNGSCHQIIAIQMTLVDQTMPRAFFSMRNKETNSTSEFSSAGQAKWLKSTQSPQKGGMMMLSAYSTCKVLEATSGGQ
jgi:hypothetical protein